MGHVAWRAQQRLVFAQLCRCGHITCTLRSPLYNSSFCRYSLWLPSAIVWYDFQEYFRFEHIPLKACMSWIIIHVYIVIIYGSVYLEPAIAGLVRHSPACEGLCVYLLHLSNRKYKKMSRNEMYIVSMVIKGARPIVHL